MHGHMSSAAVAVTWEPASLPSWQSNARGCVWCVMCGMNIRVVGTLMNAPWGRKGGGPRLQIWDVDYGSFGGDMLLCTL